MRRSRVQHRTRVAKPHHTAAVQDVRIDTSGLRGEVGSQSELASRELIDELESAQVEVTTGPGQQRIEVLDHRRHHEQVAVTAEQVEQLPAQ